MKKKEEQGGVSILDLDRHPSWEGQIVRARPVFTCWDVVGCHSNGRPFDDARAERPSICQACACQFQFDSISDSDPVSFFVWPPLNVHTMPLPNIPTVQLSRKPDRCLPFGAAASCDMIYTARLVGLMMSDSKR